MRSGTVKTMSTDSQLWVRAASIEGFADLVRRLGASPASLLGTVGLDTRVMIEPDLRIPIDKLQQLLELAAAETGEHDFGLRLAQLHGLANLGPIGILAREERTVGAALQTLIDYLHLHNSATHLRIDAGQDPALIAIFVQCDGEEPSRQTIDLAVAATAGVLRSFLGDVWNPVSAQFQYPTPRHDAAHRALFRCAVQFNAPLTALLVPRRDLDSTLQSSSPEFQRHVRLWIEGLAVRSKSEVTFADDVRRLISMLLTSGRCSADRLASYYGFHRRTLHRRLEQSGHSFTGLVNEVRRELAGRRVREGRLSLGEISHALGFYQQSSFSRWFRQEFGISAADWRRSDS